MGRKLTVAMLACTLSLASTGQPKALVYDYNAIDVPGATGGTNPHGISNAGEVVGDYSDPTGRHGFTDTAGVIRTFNVLGAWINTLAHGVNKTGQIVGTALFSDGLGAYLLRDAAGNFTPIHVPGEAPHQTAATGINSAGQIVGWRGSTPVGSPAPGFLLTGNTFTDILVPGASVTAPWAINDLGQVAGSYATAAAGGKPRRNHGFVMTNGRFVTIEFPGATDTYLYGINNLGQVVGSYYDGNGRLHGFVLAGDGFTRLDPPGSAGDEVEARGINDASQVVGFYLDRSQVYRGFVANTRVVPDAVTFPPPKTTP